MAVQEGSPSSQASSWQLKLLVSNKIIFILLQIYINFHEQYIVDMIAHNHKVKVDALAGSVEH